MDIFKNKFNYQIYDNVNRYWIFSDTSNKKYKFYFTYNINSEIKSATLLPKHWRIFNKVVASVILILALALINLLKINTSSDELYNKYYTTYNSPENNTRSISIPPDSIQIAFNKIDNKEYEEALNILNKIKNKDTVAFFYIGVLNQESGKYDQAIEKYQTVINNNNTLFVEQSKWYKGLCYIKMHKNKKALKEFRDLSKSSSYYKPYADEIIKKLK